MQMILIFDTETTGFTQNNLPAEHPSQPHLVELGCILAEEDGTMRSQVNLIIKPEGYTIPKNASDVHGITTEIAERCGVPLVHAVGLFYQLGSRAHTIVAHNLPFDERIMATAVHRTGRTPTLALPINRQCTAEMSEPILKIPPTAKMMAAGFGDKFKKPNLGECYKFFFETEMENAHSAIADARACAKVYFRIKYDEARNV